jgi:predicted SprT family Zn-dependent metalloprotease
MKRQQLHAKADRRKPADRRFRSRAGRRDTDPSPSARCPSCRSHQIALARVTHGVHEYRCWACHELWVAIPRRRKHGA